MIRIAMGGIGATLVMTAGQSLLLMLYLQLTLAWQSHGSPMSFIGGLLVGILFALVTPIMAVLKMAGAVLFMAPALFIAYRVRAGIVEYMLAGAAAGLGYGLASALHAHALNVNPSVAHHFDWLFGIFVSASNIRWDFHLLELTAWTLAGAAGGYVFSRFSRPGQSQASGGEPVAHAGGQLPAGADGAMRWARVLLWLLTLIVAPFVIVMGLVAIPLGGILFSSSDAGTGSATLTALATAIPVAIPATGLWLGWQGYRQGRPGRMLTGFAILFLCAAMVMMPFVLRDLNASPQQPAKAQKMP